MHPEIHFDVYEMTQWIEKPFSELHESMEKLRIAVKNASGYTSDNSRFLIDDVTGKAALQISFSLYDVCFWNYRNGRYMGSTTEILGKNEKFTKEILALIREWINHIENGETQCNECKRWVEKYIPFSFAGAVCEDCYDASRHKGPDTR